MTNRSGKATLVIAALMVLASFSADSSGRLFGRIARLIGCQSSMMQQQSMQSSCYQGQASQNCYQVAQSNCYQGQVANCNLAMNCQSRGFQVVNSCNTGYAYPVVDQPVYQPVPGEVIYHTLNHGVVAQPAACQASYPVYYPVSYPANCSSSYPVESCQSQYDIANSQPVRHANANYGRSRRFRQTCGFSFF